MADENGGPCIVDFFYHKCVSQELFSCTTIMYVVMSPRDDVNLCIHLTGNNKEVRQSFSIPNSRTIVPCECLRVLPRQQQSSASFGKKARRIAVSVLLRDSCKPAKPEVHTGSSPCHPHQGPIIHQMFPHQFPRRSVTSCSSVWVVPVPLLASNAECWLAQSSVIFHLQPSLHNRR